MPARGPRLNRLSRAARQSQINLPTRPLAYIMRMPYLSRRKRAAAMRAHILQERGGVVAKLRRKPFFYGWLIVAVGFFSLFVSMGARNGFGVFINPMEETLLWPDRAGISFVIAIGTLTNALTQPFIGNLYDRYGARAVISLSLLTLGGATLLLSLTSNFGMTWSVDLRLFTLTPSLLYLTLIYGVVTSSASGGVSLVTVHSLLSKWFYRRRGLALSLSTAGASAGGLILTPFAAYLMLYLLKGAQMSLGADGASADDLMLTPSDAYRIIGAHWRVVWVALGLFVLLLALPLALLIIKDSPESVGDAPDGEDALSASGSDRNGGRRAAPAFIRAPLETSNWRDSFRSAPFWQLSGAYWVCGVTTIIISAHYVPFATDLGISPGVAALAFGVMQGLNALGVIIVGVLSDKFSRKNLLGTIYFIRFLAYAILVAPGFVGLLWGVSVPPAIAIWGFATLAGLSWIATPPLTSSLTADIYGIRNIGTLNGLTTMAHQIGGALSVFMAGVLYDLTQSAGIPLSYEIPFAIAGLTLLGATFASFSVNERKFSIRYRQQPAAAPAEAA